MLDFSIFKDKIKKCCRCRNVEDAVMFVNEMKRQYPMKTRNWDFGEHHFDPDVGYIDYFPFLEPGNEFTNLCRDNHGYAERNGYVIIEFSDFAAMSIKDLGAIDCKPDLDALFSGF